jgi:hypothetical protein
MVKAIRKSRKKHLRLISKMDVQCIRRLLPKRIACGVGSLDVQFRDVIVH